MRLSIAILIVVILLVPMQVLGHGGEELPEEEMEEEPFSLTLPQIFLLTLVAALILLSVLYLVGITDKKLLVQIMVIALIFLSLDYIYVKTFA